jgi:protein-L-isoaspartate(D-aspartate) O-methyltransferase
VKPAVNGGTRFLPPVPGRGLAPLLGLLAATVAWAQDEAARQRDAMVRQEIVEAGIRDPRVIRAMRAVPRHEFVSSRYRRQAYFDMALPIGERQTISSPFIVAFMTECLRPEPEDRVLEIGTGSGYQAAVLSHLVGHVYTVEIVEPLARRARRTLSRLGYTNVSVRAGDGFLGWPEHAPFDRIIVTCSPEAVPRPLVEQLKEGGRLVIPVGERYQQTLYLLKKQGGTLVEESLRPTLFVPMTGTAESRRAAQPDPRNPTCVNGTFEQPPGDDPFLPGWYYQRQVELVAKEDAPEGRRYAQFDNQDPGRGSRLLQGFAIDGGHVERLRLSAWVRCEQVTAGPEGQLPSVIVSFYDEQRRDIGQYWLGPWQGTHAWQRHERIVRVPRRAREGIVRLGLFGATGRASFDDVQIRKLP